MKRNITAAFICCLSLFSFVPVQADEIRPGFLQLQQLDQSAYQMLWKVPAKGDRRLGLSVRLPDHCSSSEPLSRLVAGAYIERRQIHCQDGLEGGLIRIDGLERSSTDVLARVERLDGGSQTVRLTPSSPAFTLTAGDNWWSVASTYLLLGTEHILLGIDHLLFVLALLFLVQSWPRLIGTVTAFTLAHTLTLVAATMGWVRVPQNPVEAVIALSIVFVAAEIIHLRKGKKGLAVRMPWIVAFLFGLLHGLGFAGALAEVGLPQQAVPLALAFFNIGVEIGQLLFITGVFCLFWLLKPLLARWTAGAKHDTWQTAAVVSVPAAYIIGTLATFWVLERTIKFFI